MGISQKDYESLIQFDFFINKDMNNFSDNVLFAMESFFDFPLTVYTLFNKDADGKRYVEDIFSRNISEDGLIRYQQKIFESDLFVQQVDRNRQGNLHKNLVTISDLAGNELFYDSDYGNYLMNINTPYQVVLRSTSSKLYPSHILCVFKTKEQGDFTRDELDLLSKIGDSFDRSVTLYERNHKNLTYRGFAAEIASVFGHELAVLDERETMVFQSDGLGKMLETCFGVQSNYMHISELRERLRHEKQVDFHQLTRKESFFVNDIQISIWPYFCDTGRYQEKFWFISVESGETCCRADMPEEREYDKQMRMIQHNFTSREMDVARLLMEGKNNKEIAELLCINYSTVKFHVQNIYRKLGAENRNAAIIKLLE